ncbi:hypothetical protein I4U23_008996 [Adineta vaga]|nr:hypothetical protein I4U23_008996 [Adineta vaga]
MEVLPSIQAQSTPIYSTIGKSIHLRCSATVPYDTSLYWQRLDSHNISNQSTRFRQQQHIHGDLSHTTLYIKDLEKADFGIYACCAESRAGRSKAVIQLKGTSKHYHSTTMITTQTSIEIQMKENDLLKTTTSRTQLLKRNKRKMNLITLIQNLSEKNLSSIPEIIYDDNGRYVQLKNDDILRKNFVDKFIQYDESSIPLSTYSVFSSSSALIKSKLSNLSLNEQYQSIADEFNLSILEIEKQYELALKNRLEIPPILMRRLIIDAIGIFQIMINEFNHDTERNEGKFQRISKRLSELEIYNKLFDHHC